MIDIFERFAPQYSSVLRRFALDVWFDRADVDSLLRSAGHFKKRYEAELIQRFRRRGLSFSPSRIKELSDLWLAEQLTTSKRIIDISEQKKKKLNNEIETVESIERGKVELFGLPKTETKGLARVLPDTTFSGNLARRALQIGEEEAFALGRDLNHFVVSTNSDVYKWMSQNDNRVRTTHQILHGKLFSYNSPPTTKDKYGHVHTGNPGTDWGCRCWEEEARGKPLIGFIARATK